MHWRVRAASARSTVERLVLQVTSHSGHGSAMIRTAVTRLLELCGGQNPGARLNVVTKWLGSYNGTTPPSFAIVSSVD